MVFAILWYTNNYVVLFMSNLATHCRFYDETQKWSNPKYWEERKKIDLLTMTKYCYFQLFTVGIYFRTQSGNHMPLILHVFEHFEASQTNRRDKICSNEMVWWIPLCCGGINSRILWLRLENILEWVLM